MKQVFRDHDMTISQENSTVSGIAKGVRDRLLDTAEELFCERGFKGTSIRDIASSAGCNIASVNYYFGGKENLYVEMFRRHMTSLLDEQIENVQKAMTSDHPTLEQLLRTLVVSTLRPLNGDSGKRSLLKMMVREILDPHLKAAIMVDELIGKFLTELRDAIIKLCPGLKSETGMLCVYSFDGIILHALLFSEYYHERYPDLKVDELIDHVVRFSAAGIRAYAGGEAE
jgi:AcrR family transcriptional regulator